LRCSCAAANNGKRRERPQNRRKFPQASVRSKFHEFCPFMVAARNGNDCGGPKRIIPSSQSIAMSQDEGGSRLGAEVRRLHLPHFALDVPFVAVNSQKTLGQLDCILQ